MRAVGKGDGEWEPERAEGEWKAPGNDEQEKSVKWSKAGECVWKCSLELGEAQLAQPRTGLEYKNEVGTEDIWRVTDSSLVEGLGSAMMPESLFFLLWFLDTPGSIAASLGECLLQWLSSELLTIFLWFFRGERRDYWFIIVWGKNHSFLKPLSASLCWLLYLSSQVSFRPSGSEASPAVLHRAWRGAVCKQVTSEGKHQTPSLVLCLCLHSKELIFCGAEQPQRRRASLLLRYAVCGAA